MLLKVSRLTLPVIWLLLSMWLFFFNDTATTEIYTLSLHDALPISSTCSTRSPTSPRRPRPRLPPPATTRWPAAARWTPSTRPRSPRSEEHTSELQSLAYLVCRLLLEKKKAKYVNKKLDMDHAAKGEPLNSTSYMAVAFYVAFFF